jgi:hypothetical protein
LPGHVWSRQSPGHAKIEAVDYRLVGSGGFFTLLLLTV